MVSAAKAAGGLAALYPKGNAAEAPWPLAQAISHALSVLNWMELPEDDRPPEFMWLEPEMLQGHFDEVKRRWADKAGGNGGDVAPPMQENELTKGMRSGR